MRAEWAHDIATAQKGAAAMFDQEISNLVAIQVTVSGETVVPYRDFNIGWAVPHDMGARVGKHSRRVASIAASFNDGRWMYEVTA